MDRYGLNIVREITGAEPIELADLKAFLGVDFDDSDTVLSKYISQARADIEQFTGMALVEQTVTLTAEYWSGTYPLPFPNVSEVTSVTNLSETELTYTAIGKSRLNIDAESGCIVTYVSGVSVPESVKHLVCMVAGCLFDKELIPVYKDEIMAAKRDLKKHS